MAETTGIGIDEDELGAVGGAAGGNPGATITIEDYEMVDENIASNSGNESQKTKLRPRCQYAEDCYRKKPHHRKTYCHPGDEDWNGGEKRRPKPRCPFGEFCTRRNARHMQYFHQQQSEYPDRSDDDAACSGASCSKDAYDDGDKRQITENDFNAVRPKVRTVGSAIKGQKSDASAQRPRQATTSTNRAKQSVADPPKKKSVFECGCCFLEDIPIGEGVSCGDDHLFCRDCLKNYVNSIIFGVGKTTLYCLGPDCEALFSPVNLGFIDPKSLQSLEERQQKEMLASAFGEIKDERLHNCPSCDFTCLVPASAQHFVCFQCKREFCLFCGVDWRKHMDYGYICDDVEGDDESKIRLKTEEAMTDAYIRKCHKCSTPLLKESGCNKMTCRCGAFLCYICRQPVAGYDHFCQHTTAPGQGKCVRPGCGKCSLIDEPVDTPKIEAERVKGEAERSQLGAKDRKKIGGDVGAA